MSKFYKFDQKDPNVVHIFNDKNLEPQELGNNGLDVSYAISALSAASDFFKFDAYGHEETEVGLHFYKTVDPKKIVKRVGWVSASYTGLHPVEMPTLQRYPTGWAPVIDDYGMRRLGSFRLDPVEVYNDVPRNRSRHAMNARRKHIIVDFLLQGYPLMISLQGLPEESRNKFFTGYKSVWEETDLEVAQQLAYDLYWSSVNFKQTSAKNYVREKKIESGEAESLAQTLITPDEEDNNFAVLAMKVHDGGKPVNLFTLEAGVYGISDYRKAGNYGIPWNPENERLIERWAGYIADGCHIRLKK